jgi:glycosyltransferase involved in cell wall biosynthesis
VTGHTEAAVVYGSRAGIGGMGHSVSTAITAVAKASSRAAAFGPGASLPWSLPGGTPNVEWVQSPPGLPSAIVKYSWLRWRSGQLSLLRDRRLGRWAAGEVQRRPPERLYLFTQVALETLQWAAREGVPTVLDNPNGHIRNFRQICERESQALCGRTFHGHPTANMVERVEEEYRLADYVRVYSEWGKASMVQFGVPERKIQIIRQTLNLSHFRPPEVRPPGTGPLRVCYVGSLDLRKGFVYLLRAIRALGPRHIVLRIAGATGDRDCARLFKRESAGLQIELTPGDSLPAYQQAELFVVPTLEDGLPFVLVEGLACGLPVIVTKEAGAGECVRPGETGWVVPAAQPEPIAAALDQALLRRHQLAEMGRQARADVEQYAGPARLQQLAEWFHDVSRVEACA